MPPSCHGEEPFVGLTGALCLLRVAARAETAAVNLADANIDESDGFWRDRAPVSNTCHGFQMFHCLWNDDVAGSGCRPGASP
jgi:hypothetical protein